jgi:hypothetical protein
MSIYVVYHMFSQHTECMLFTCVVLEIEMHAHWCASEQKHTHTSWNKKMKLVSLLHIETSVTWICFSHGLPMFLSVAEKLTSFFVIVKK